MLQAVQVIIFRDKRKQVDNFH